MALLLDPDELEQGKKAHQCLDEIIFSIKTQRHTLWRDGCWAEKKRLCRQGTWFELVRFDALHLTTARGDRHTQSQLNFSASLDAYEITSPQR